MRRRIAIIPARGGSKRIPKKNIVEFISRPMIAWTIQAAIDSCLFDKILVSTDDQAIANTSLAAGAAVPFFRLAHGDDHAPVSKATIGALEQAEAHWQTRFDQVVQLMPNCPLRTAEDIRLAVDHFESGKHSFQISCFQFGWMNPWWSFRISNDGEPVNMFPDELTKRSQDLPPLYCPTGAIWIAARDSLLSSGTFYGPEYRCFPMNWESAVDIDDWSDFRMALAVAKMRQDQWHD